MKTVLLICTHNSARSQIAEGRVRALKGNYYEAYSAGSYPSGVHPCAIRVMREINIDISSQCSKILDEFRQKEFDYAITVCDNSLEACPFFPYARNILHKSFSDPARQQGTAEKKLLAFRQIRDEMALWIQQAFQPDEINVNER